MQIPLYSRYEFIDQNVFNTEMSLVYNNWTNHNAYFNTPGMVNGGSVVIGTSTLTVNITAAPPVGVQFSSGTLSQGFGNTNGASSSVYSINAATFVPTAGSQTVYFVAQYAQVSESQIVLVGPPPGHPDYDPTFNPTTAYTQNWDSFNIVATLTPPNNTTNVEVARVLLSSGQSSIPASSVVTTSQVPASSYAPLYGLLSGNNPWTGTNTFGGSSVFNGAISAGGNNVWSGTNTWSSSATFTSAVSANSTFRVGGAATFASTVNVSGAITSAGNNTWTGTNAFSSTVTVPTGNFPGTMLANGYNEFTVFLANGNFTPLFTGNYIVYAIGGGGGGGGGGAGATSNGGQGGGGGGGGGIGWSIVSLTAGTNYAVVIGTGGTAGTAGAGNGGDGGIGNPTTFNGVTIGAGGCIGKFGFAASFGAAVGGNGGAGAGNGGGTGGQSATVPGAGTAGTANTGGGGGGGGGGNGAHNGAAGGAGGTGILIVWRA